MWVRPIAPWIWIESNGTRSLFMRLSFPLFFSLFFILLASSLFGGEILLNPSFESDVNLNGVPDFWVRQRWAVADHDPLTAFEGNVSVRTSAYHSFIQNQPVFGGTRLCFSGFLRGEVGNEYQVLACEFRAKGAWRNYQRDYTIADFFYSPRGVSFLAPQDADLAAGIFTTLFFREWVAGDVFSLADEFIHNPDFETLAGGSPTGWFFVGHPVVDSSGQNAASGSVEVRCDDQNYFYQDIAVFHDKKYKLVFHARSDDASFTPEVLALAFFDQDLQQIGEESVPYTAQAGHVRFMADMSPPEKAIFLRLSLKTRADLHTPIWFDAFGLYACTASPLSFSPNEDAVYDQSSIVFLLNDPATVSVDILDQDKAVLRSLLPESNRGKGIHSVSWDGLDDNDRMTSPGSYIFRVEMKNELNGDVTLTSPVELQSPAPLVGSFPDFSGFFPRGIWLHLGGRYGERVDYKTHLALLAQAGFNTILPNWIPANRLEDLMDAADQNGLNVIAHTQNLDALIVKYPDFFYEKPTETELRDAVATTVAQLSPHPSLLGYYIRDEVGRDYVTSAGNAAKILRGLDPLHPAFSSIPAIPDLADRFNALDTAVLLHHFYPIRYARPIKPEIFNAYCADLEIASQSAQDKGRPLWMILQGFADEKNRRIPTPAEMRCQVWLALAYGARGIFYFVSQSFYQIQGLFSYDSEPFPIFDTVKQLNREMEILSPTLLDLAPAGEFALPIPDHAVRCFTSSAGVPYVFVVNKDCLSTKTQELIVDITNVTGVWDVMTSAPLSFYYEAGQTHIPQILSPGAGRLIQVRTNKILPSAPGRIPREAIFSSLFLPNISFEEEEYFSPPGMDSMDDVLAHVPLEGLLSAVTVEDGYAYIPALDYGLHVVDVRRPWAPEFRKTISGFHYYDNVCARGDQVFVADSSGGVLIFSQDEKGELDSVGEWWGHTGSPLCLSLQDNRLYLGSGGLIVLDVSEPTTPVLVSRGEDAEIVRAVLSYGQIVYLLDEFLGIHVEDMTTTTPFRICTIPLNRPLAGAIKGDLMAVACGEYGIKIFSLEDPEAPILTGEIPLIHTDSVGFYRDRWLFAAAGTDGIAVIELTEDGEPRLVKFHQPLPGYYARSLHVDDYFLYVLYPYAGLYILSPSLILDPDAGKDFDGFQFY